MNDEGLAFHAAGYEMPDLRGKTANATDPKGQVNSPIPPQWLEKESIKTMRKRQEPPEKTRTIENGL